MNVLQLIFSIEKGGAETYLYNLIDDLKYDVSYFVVCNHKGSNYEKMASKTKNFKIIKLNHVFDIRASIQIAKYCKINDIDIIQTHFLRENYIAVLSKLFNPKVKIVWTGHLIANNKKTIKFINKIFSKFVDKIITVSKAVKDSFIDEKISFEKIKVIYNGIDTDYFRPKKSNNIREELIIDKDTLLLTTVSRFHKDKGHEFLVQVLKELKNREIKFKMLLVGDGEEKQGIQSEIIKFNLTEEVIFLGYREDIPEILSATDIYISPSKSEAISFSILEALSCGNLVVATDVGGVPEIFSKGYCGKLLPYGDFKRFAEEIINLYNSKEYNTKNQDCRDIVKDYFSKDLMLKETYSLYKELINKKNQ